MKAPAHAVELPREEIALAPGRRPALAFGVGAVALVAAVVLGVGDLPRLYQAYLVAFLYFVSVALGGLFFVLLQFLTRAGWSVVVRRLAENVMGTLPVFVLLFVPVALGLHDLYHWSHAEAVAADPILAGKQAWLNPSGWLLRSAVYLVSWAVLGWWFRSRSLRQDESGDPQVTRRFQSLSAPAMIWFAVTLTLASIDWLKSLDPHWFSTIFGVYFFSGSTVAILAVLCVLAIRLQARGVLSRSITGEHYHDLGKLLFGFNCFWAYIAFSQFMLIWYGNLPEETAWYLHRWQHGWREVSIFLAVGHFVIPFLFLLPRGIKRRRSTLLAASVWLLFMHWVDLYWLAMPAFGPEAGFSPHLLDLLTFVGVGGVFCGTLALLLRGARLIPVRDPRLAESLAFENA